MLVPSFPLQLDLHSEDHACSVVSLDGEMATDTTIAELYLSIWVVVAMQNKGFCHALMPANMINPQTLTRDFKCRVWTLYLPVQLSLWKTASIKTMSTQFLDSVIARVKHTSCGQQGQWLVVHFFQHAWIDHTRENYVQNMQKWDTNQRQFLAALSQLMYDKYVLPSCSFTFWQQKLPKWFKIKKQHTQLVIMNLVKPQPCGSSDYFWLTTDWSVATVSGLTKSIWHVTSVNTFIHRYHQAWSSQIVSVPTQYWNQATWPNLYHPVISNL